MSEPEPPFSESLSSELKGFEASLAALAPVASRIDRDQLMYQAGRASRSSPVVPWSIAAVSSAILCTLAVLVIASGDFRRQSPVTSPIVDSSDVQFVNEQPDARLTEPDSYLQLRRRLSETELAAVDADRSSQAAPNAADRNALLHELLN